MAATSSPDPTAVHCLARACMTTASNAARDVLVLDADQPSALAIVRALGRHGLRVEVAASQDGGDGLDLDGGGGFIAVLAHSLHDGRGQVQFVECH